MDLELNEEMSVHLDDTGEFATVDGYKEFEQQVRIMIHSQETDIYRNLSAGAATGFIKGKIEDIARQHELLDSVDKISVEHDPLEEYGSYVVNVTYSVADDFNEVFDL